VPSSHVRTCPAPLNLAALAAVAALAALAALALATLILAALALAAPALALALATLVTLDWFSSCVDQYSTLLYQKLFFKCSTSLHNTLPTFFLTAEPDTSVRKKLIFPPKIDGFK
jgi:hypothetical protein